MKSILLVCTFAISSSAFSLTIDENFDAAKAVPAYFFTCQSVAIQKLQIAADNYGVPIDIKSVRLVGFDSKNFDATRLSWSADASTEKKFSWGHMINVVTETKDQKRCF